MGATRLGRLEGSAGERPLRALVAGHVCLDVVPTLDRDLVVDEGQLHHMGPLDVRLGGSVSTTGTALRALGMAVSVAAVVGRDALSRLTIALLRDRDLDVSQVRRIRSPASTTLVLQPPGRDRSFWHHTGANDAFDGAAIDLADQDLLHLGYPSLLPALWANEGQPLVDLFVRARAAGALTSLDLAVIDQADAERGPHWPTLLARVLPHTHLVTPSIEDLDSAWAAQAPWATVAHGPERLVAAAEHLRALGADSVMVTGGVAGVAVAAAGESTAYLPTMPVERVVTTTGAGDVASAAFIHSRLTGASATAAGRRAVELAAAHVAGLTQWMSTGAE